MRVAGEVDQFGERSSNLPLELVDAQSQRMVVTHIDCNMRDLGLVVWEPNVFGLRMLAGR